MPDIMEIDADIVAVVTAKNNSPSCFCIFKDRESRRDAEKRLDGRKFWEGYITVDSYNSGRKWIPVNTYELEETRQALIIINTITLSLV